MKNFNFWLLASLFVAAFTLSACGDDEENGNNNGGGNGESVTVNDLVGTWTINSTDNSYVAIFTQDQVTLKENGEVEFQGPYSVKDGVVSVNYNGQEFKSVPGLLYGKSVLVMKQVIKNDQDENEMLGMILFKEGKTVTATSNDIQGFWCWYEESGEEGLIIRTALKINGDNFELIITPWGERYVGTYVYSNGIIKLNVTAAYTSREEGTGYGTLWGRMNPQTLECDDWRVLNQDHWHVDAVSHTPFIANGDEAYGFIANLPAILEKKK